MSRFSNDIGKAEKSAYSACPRFGCLRCIKDRGETINGLPANMSMMIVCPQCGDKRCPHAEDHRNPCKEAFGNESAQPVVQDGKEAEQAKSPQLTDWFPPEIKPARVGVYEVAISRHVSFYSLWNGEFWLYPAFHHVSVAARETERSWNQDLLWRGLSADPEPDLPSKTTPAREMYKSMARGDFGTIKESQSDSKPKFTRMEKISIALSVIGVGIFIAMIFALMDLQRAQTHAAACDLIEWGQQMTRGDTLRMAFNIERGMT